MTLHRKEEQFLRQCLEEKVIVLFVECFSDYDIIELKSNKKVLIKKIWNLFWNMMISFMKYSLEQ